MSDADMLIARLSAESPRTHRLLPPTKRALLWLAASLWGAAFLLPFADLPAVARRLMTTPDLGIAFAGAVLTTITSAIAAFQTSVPGRSSRWALLPLPPLLLWVCASGAGCLRAIPAAFTVPESRTHPEICIYFILVVSAPLAAIITWQIMRACPLRPALTATLAGLASAAGAASLLTLIHPFDATVEDLAAHAAAVILVIGTMLLLRGRSIRPNLF